MKKYTQTANLANKRPLNKGSMMIGTLPDHLSVKRWKNNKVKSINTLQLNLKFGQLINKNLLLGWNKFIFLGATRIM